MNDDELRIYIYKYYKGGIKFMFNERPIHSMLTTLSPIKYTIKFYLYFSVNQKRCYLRILIFFFILQYTKKNQYMVLKNVYLTHF